MLSIAVVLPAFNEADSLQKLLSRIMKFTSRIIVVDDGSTDQTRVIAQSAKVKVITNQQNYGKGASIRRGLKYALKLYPEIHYIATLDADGQHAPEDLPQLQKAMISNKADIVVGHRKYLPRNGVSMPERRYLINYLTSSFIRTIYKLQLSDIQSGYRLYKASKLSNLLLGLNTTKFQTETEVLLEAWAWNLKIIECPVQLIYPSDRKNISRLSVLDGFRWFLMTFFRILNFNKWIQRRQIKSNSRQQALLR
ncbi:MAG: glycosyltransferase family 2 protein [Candidatus Hodarchaeales archaeon]